MQQLSTGATLQGGKYIIERVLGQGGFGITYLAENTYFVKKVAIKEFFPQGFCVRDNSTGYVPLRPAMEKHKKKFIAEAKKLAQLNHKGIVKVFEVFEENGTAYYVMDYIAGQTLWEIIQQRQFSVKESLQVIGKVSKALIHIHSKRMLHLDIKPMNIMIRSVDNEPIIIDFGISKTFDAKGNPNTTFLPAASPGYSPAEQFAGEVDKFAPQLDIYSLGATFYTMLTRSVPTYPTPLTVSKLTFDSSIPFYVEKAVKTAMAYRQEERYATVKDFLVALNLASPYSSKKTSIVTPNNEIDKPIIKTFCLKSEGPYYEGEELELSWWVQKCERVYLNGKLQSGSKQSKKVKYDSPGKKRFTLKAVKGIEEVSVTRNFEILPKEALKKADETKIILAEVIKEKKPEIIFFRRIGNEQLYVDDNVSVYWDVKDAENVSIAGIYGLSIKNNKTEVPLIFEGNNDITLIAQNEVGEVRKTISVKAIR